MVACCEVVEMLQAVKSHKVCSPVLMACIMRHLKLFQDAYDEEDYWKPKHNYTLHLPEQLHLFGMLLNCFCVERKHRMLKRYALHRRGKNTEIGLLEDITIHGLIELADLQLKKGIA